MYSLVSRSRFWDFTLIDKRAKGNIDTSGVEIRIVYKRPFVWSVSPSLFVLVVGFNYRVDFARGLSLTAL